MSIRVMQAQRKERTVAPPVRHAVSLSIESPAQSVRELIGGRTPSLPSFDFSRIRVHSGDDASRSARLLSARGYSVGNHVVLDTQRFPLTTETGQRVLTHELVHAVGKAESNAVPDSVADPNGEAEHEASAVAHAATVWKPTSPSNGQRTPAIQRDLLAYSREHLDVLPGSGESGFTGITYAGDAAAIQAALAPLIKAGTVSSRNTAEGVMFSAAPASWIAVSSALASFARPAEMAIAIVNPHQLSVFSSQEVTKYYGLWPVEISRQSSVIERQSARPLTSAERAEAMLVFGGSIDYDMIQLDEDPVMSVGGYARTTPRTINFPTGSFASSDFMPWLIHELTHSWQYQHGVSLATTLYHAIASTYDYGGEAGLLAATAAGHHLRDFNTEQQGDIARDFYVRLKAGNPTAAWAPFIAELTA